MTAAPATDELARKSDKAGRLGASTISGKDKVAAPNSLLRLWSFGLAALMGVIVLTGLGIWQIERRLWKLELIDHVEQRIHAAPLPAPGPDSWPRINATDDTYRHVSIAGHFLDKPDTLVKAVTDRGGGFWVIAPFQTATGFTVLVNRGFISADQAKSGWRTDIGTAGTSLSGLVRMTEPDGGFLRSNDPSANRWYSRDVAAIASARDLGTVAPYFIDADAKANPGGIPVGGLTVVNFPNNHLVYALTWFAMALMLAAASIAIGRSEWRTRKAFRVSQNSTEPPESASRGSVC